MSVLLLIVFFSRKGMLILRSLDLAPPALAAPFDLAERACSLTLVGKSPLLLSCVTASDWEEASM